jgi:ESCRT-II complex subunit VPS36
LGGANVSVLLTNHRLLVLVPVQPSPQTFALQFSRVVKVKDSSTSGLFFMQATCSVDLRVSVEEKKGLRLSFGTEIVKNAFLQQVQRVFSAKAWATVPSALPLPLRIASPAKSPPATGVPVGIAGLQRQQQQQLKQSAEITRDASKDLEHLMAKAQEVVRIVDKYARLLQQTSEEAALATSAEAVDESREMEAILQSIGMISPVTKLSAGRKYHQELARQLADLLQAEGRLSRLGGMVPLPAVYCLFNRARGTELVSPDDLYKAAGLLEDLHEGMRLRSFSSGVLVIQSSSLDDEEIARRLVALCSATPDEGMLATEVAASLGVSLSLCKEQLSLAEQWGALCRDESAAGVRYFPNIFATF